MIGKLTQKDMERYIAELDSEQVILYCTEHPNYGGKLPPKPQENGCVKCWTIFYIKMQAGFPEAARDEMLDLLTSAVTKSAELAEQGKFDVELYDHPIIHTDKDALPN